MMASDGQSTELVGDQFIRFTSDKIHQLGKNVLWGGSGDGGAIQEIKAKLDGLGPACQGSHQSLRAAFSEKVFEVNQLRFTRWRQMPRPNTQPPTAAFSLLAQYEGDKPRIVEFQEHGAATNYEQVGYHAIGSGSVFACANLWGYDVKKCTMDQAKTLAYMTVYKAIEIAAFGLGYPIDVWTITRRGDSVSIVQATKEEREALEDATKTIIQRQVEVFTAHMKS